MTSAAAVTTPKFWLGVNVEKTNIENDKLNTTVVKSIARLHSARLHQMSQTYLALVFVHQSTSPRSG
jgi:hypothetical protein